MWDGRPSNTFSDHEVAVGLRCGKVNTKTPKYIARLDPAFARGSSGLSVLFSIKEESTKLARPRLPSPRGLTEKSLLR